MSTTKPGKKTPATIGDHVVEMIVAGETSRVLESYVIDLSLVVTPVFKEASSKKACRK